MKIFGYFVFFFDNGTEIDFNLLKGHLLRTCSFISRRDITVMSAEDSGEGNAGVSADSL